MDQYLLFSIFYLVKRFPVCNLWSKGCKPLNTDFIFWFTVFAVQDMLLDRVFEMLRTSLNKHELRYMMHKLHLPEDKVAEIETTYHGRDKLQDRIYHTFKWVRDIYSFKWVIILMLTTPLQLHWLNSGFRVWKARSCMIFLQGTEINSFEVIADSVESVDTVFKNLSLWIFSTLLFNENSRFFTSIEQIDWRSAWGRAQNDSLLEKHFNQGILLKILGFFFTSRIWSRSFPECSLLPLALPYSYITFH